MPPISCTSKGRRPSVRRAASRALAKASGNRSSRLSPLPRRARNSTVFFPELFVGQLLDGRLEGSDLRDHRPQPLYLSIVLGTDYLRE
jgi:hypothetical protein